MLTHTRIRYLAVERSGYGGGGFEAMARGPSGHGAQNELRRESMVEQHVMEYERPKVVTLWREVKLEALNSEQA